MELIALEETPLDFGVTTIELAADQAGLPTGMIARVRFPRLMRFDHPTPDKRLIRKAGFTNRDLPLPIAYKDTVTAPGTGHLGARAAGTLTEITFGADETSAYLAGAGYLADLPAGREAHTALRTRSVKGVSVDLTAGEMDAADEAFATEQGLRAVWTRSTLAQVTICQIPAFPDAYGELDDGEIAASATMHTDTLIRRPAAWFKNPGFTRPTPWTVDGDHCFGHIWLRAHGKHRDTGRVEVPLDDDFIDFQGGAGVVHLDDGSTVSTGRVFMGGPHMMGVSGGRPTPAEINAAYSSTSNAIADVVAGYDEFGVWVNGALRPGLGPHMLYAAAASPVSGHWVPSIRARGRRRLHTVLCVNSEGHFVGNGFEAGEELVASAGLAPAIEMASGDVTHGVADYSIDGEAPTKATIMLIPDRPDELTVDGGEPADALHLTLRYLDDPAAWPPDARVQLEGLLAEMLSEVQQGPFMLDVAGFGELGGDGARVIFVESDGLCGFAEMVELAVRSVAEQFGIDVPDAHDAFLPHVTLAYAGAVDALAARMGESFTASKIRVAWATEITEIELAAESVLDAVLADAPEPPRAPAPVLDSFAPVQVGDYMRNGRRVSSYQRTGKDARAAQAAAVQQAAAPEQGMDSGAFRTLQLRVAGAVTSLIDAAQRAASDRSARPLLRARMANLAATYKPLQAAESSGGLSPAQRAQLDAFRAQIEADLAQHSEALSAVRRGRSGAPATWSLTRL